MPKTLLIAVGAAALLATSFSPAGAVNAGTAAATGTPHLVRVTPSHGTTVGGARVVLWGTGFSGVRAVWFGQRRSLRFQLVGPHRLAVRTPLHPAGRFRVRVVTAAGPSPLSDGVYYRFRSPRVVLDPGHNGENASHPRIINRLVPMGYGRKKPCNTTGTATNAGYPEHAFNWSVATRARAMLRADFVKVIMTRPNDHGVGPCVNIRARIESTPGVAAAVAIHADGAPAWGHGFHVNEDSRRPVGATEATVHKSTRLGIALHNALVRYSGLTPSNYIGNHGYVRRDDLAGLNLSRNPTSFLELGNMRNARDARLQMSPRGRERIARAVVLGILAYLRS
jgi:N-acetylmuramoyl-L-alanine amidase